MALSDMMLVAKVNLALVRDPRVSSLDIGVQAGDGVVTLTGDVDSRQERAAAQQIASGVDGVKRIENGITCGVGAKQDTAELVSQRFLDKLEEEWNNLPNNSALVQADYLKWALWMIYKLRIPHSTTAEAVAEEQARTTDEAIKAVAGRLNCPPAIIGLELQRIAEEADPVFQADGPTMLRTGLATSPVGEEPNNELAA